MEIAYMSPRTIRIKGKKGSILLDPTAKMPKTQADAIVVFTGIDISRAKVDGQRIIIDGPGEYEVSSIKIKGERNNGSILYNITADGVEILVGSIEDIIKNKSKFNLVEAKDYQALVLYSSATPGKDTLLSLDAKYVVLYGFGVNVSDAIEGKKITPVNKLSINADKLPAEPEVILLR